MKFRIRSENKTQAIDISDLINERLADLSVDPVGVNVWVPHTTAGVTVNEANDPDVMSDLIDRLDSLVPQDGPYDHAEGNAPAHIKSILLGSHQWIPVTDYALDLGRWQGVFLLEWDGPRQRTIRLHPDT